MYDGDKQVGFARIVTDSATVGWICDMFILPSHRSSGLGKWLVECMMEHPDVKGLRRILLNTRDAHDLYMRNMPVFDSLLTRKSGWKNSLATSLRHTRQTQPPHPKKPTE